MQTVAILKREAELAGVILNIEKGRTRDDRGEITLEAPDGKQFAPELHGLVTEQQDDYEKGGLEPWLNVVEAALQDLRANLPLSVCPADCPCKETD
jgi:hypothetical protein